MDDIPHPPSCAYPLKKPLLLNFASQLAISPSLLNKIKNYIYSIFRLIM
jgi:hypothetical protein